VRWFENGRPGAGGAAGRFREVVERDAHLGSLQEAARAPHPYRNPGAPEDRFELRRLGVRAVQHRQRRPRSVGTVLAPKPGRDTDGLRLVVGVGSDRRFGPVGFRRADRGRSRAAVGEDAARGGDDLR
jgi:hypothetical protein